MNKIQFKKNTYVYSCGLDSEKCIHVIKNLYFNYTHNVRNTNSSYSPRLISHSDNIKRLKKELDAENIRYQSNFKIDDVIYEIRLLHSNILLAIQSSSQKPTFESIQNQSETAEHNEMLCYHLYDWNNYSQFVKSLQSRYEIKEPNYVIEQIRQEDSEIFTKRFNSNNVNSKYTISIGAKRIDTPKNDIIMMMSFKLSDDSSYEWLITQMVTKPHYYVLNGYRSILSKFVDTFDPVSIRAIFDRSKSSGSMLKCLDFQKISEMPSQIIWSQYKSAISTSLIKSVIDIADDKIYDMMINSKYLPVPDCGYDIYEWRR